MSPRVRKTPLSASAPAATPGAVPPRVIRRPRETVLETAPAALPEVAAQPATGRKGGGATEQDFAEKLKQLEVARAQADEIVRAAGEGELKLEEASTKMAIQLIMEMLMLKKRLKEGKSGEVVKVLDVLARLQAANVLRERLRADFRAAVEKAREALVTGVRKAVHGNTRLRQELQALIDAQAERLLAR
jgi:hypothetical protein